MQEADNISYSDIDGIDEVMYQSPKTSQERAKGVSMDSSESSSDEKHKCKTGTKRFHSSPSPCDLEESGLKVKRMRGNLEVFPGQNYLWGKNDPYVCRLLVAVDVRWVVGAL